MQIKDGKWLLVNYDIKTGRSLWKYIDGNKIHFRTDYPATAIIESNHQHYMESQNQRFGNGKRIASVPLNIFYEKLFKAHNEGDRKYINKWLNDSNNKAYRTFKGQA